jgi:hypothetical protein
LLIVRYIPPRYRGALASHKTRGGDAVAGGSRRRCGAAEPSAVKPRRPGAPAVRHWGLAEREGKLGLIGSPALAKAPRAVVRRETRSGSEESTPERSDHRGRRGENLRNTARGTPECLGGLAALGLQHASMLRGVEVRGSFGTLASRAPSVLPRVRRRAAEARQSEGGKDCDEGLPGADQRTWAMLCVWTSPQGHCRA